MVFDIQRRTPLAAALVVCCAVFAMRAGAADSPRERLVAEINRLGESSGGQVGVAAIHLESGRSVLANQSERYPMASTYKVPIAVQLLARVDQGEMALDDMVEIEARDLHPGSGTLTRLFDDPGVALSVHNLLELMLLISDNSATDICLRLAGGAGAVNERLQALGIDGIRVDRPTSLLIASYLGVEAPEDGRISISDFRKRADKVDESARRKAAREFAVDERDTSTPAAMAELLRAIWKGEALSGDTTELLIDILLRVETGENRLKGLLPPGTRVAHKTGTIGATTNDVGIVYLPDDAGHVVAVVFVKDSSEPVQVRERAIAQVARSLYDYFLFSSAE